MPKLKHWNLNPQGEIGIWDIKEEETFFSKELGFSKEEEKQLLGLQGKRRIEWLAVRYLLHKMSGRQVRGVLIKDEFGKPHLENADWHISISHSHNVVSVIASPQLNGIDIQVLVPKIERLAHKFMRPVELDSLKDKTRIEQLHVYWGAKEALYKAYGRKKIDFKQHLCVKPFKYDLSSGRTTAVLKKEDLKLHFDVFYKKIESYILVWVNEQG